MHQPQSARHSLFPKGKRKCGVIIQLLTRLEKLMCNETKKLFDIGQDSSPPPTKLKRILSVTLTSHLVLKLHYNDDDRAQLSCGEFVDRLLNYNCAKEPFALRSARKTWSSLAYWIPASAERRFACSYPPCETLHLFLPTREAN